MARRSHTPGPKAPAPTLQPRSQPAPAALAPLDRVLARLRPDQLAAFAAHAAGRFPVVEQELRLFQLYEARQTDRAAHAALLRASVERHYRVELADYEADGPAPPPPFARGLTDFPFGGMLEPMGPPTRADILPDVADAHLRALLTRPDPVQGRFIRAGLLALLEVDIELSARLEARAVFAATADTETGLPAHLETTAAMLQQLAAAPNLPPDYRAATFAELLAVGEAAPFSGSPAHCLTLALTLRLAAAVADGPDRADAYCRQTLVTLTAAVAAATNRTRPAAELALSRLVELYARFLTDERRDADAALTLLAAHFGSSPAIRQQYVRELQARGRGADAYAALRDWLNGPGPNENPREAHEWRAELLRLAATSTDPDLLRDAAHEQLRFLGQGGYLSPAEIRRALLAVRNVTPDWPTAGPALLTGLRAERQKHRGGAYLLPQIERAARQLDQEVRSLAADPTWVRLRDLDRAWLYANPAHSPDALVELYARALPRLFTGKTAVSRTDYQLIAQRLRGLVDLPGADEPVALLVEKLVTDYGRRKALLEELRSAGFGTGAPAPIRLGDGNGEFDNDEEPTIGTAAPARRGRRPNPAKALAGLVPETAKKRGRKPNPPPAAAGPAPETPGVKRRGRQPGSRNTPK